MTQQSTNFLTSVFRPPVEADTQSVSPGSAPLTSELGFPESPHWTSKRPSVGQFKVSTVTGKRLKKEKRKKEDSCCLVSFTSHLHLYYVTFVMLCQLCRYSYAHPAEHHWAFTPSSGRPARAPVNYGERDQNIAHSLLPGAPAVQPLERHRIYPTKRSLLPAGDRI